MPYEFVLPELSENADEGVVVAWFKREGAAVEAGEMLLEVQLEKVSYEVAAPVSGTLARILTPKDAVIKRGQILALILQPGEAARPPETVTTPAAAEETAAPAFIPSSPAARRLARELGINLADVQTATGSSRITEEDVRAALAARDAAGRDKTILLSPMRRTIARRMTESLQTMAQLTLVSEADVSDLVDLRGALKARFDVTVTDMVVRAVVLALKAHPHINARLDGDSLRLLDTIDIGIAVALDDGLVTPVLHDAGSLPLDTIAAETKRLAGLARDGKLSAADLSGGSFTVTNLGTYGIDAFTPIINPPQIAILGVGRIVERPARKDDQLVWRQMMTLSLTFDHAAVDGAPAAAFLASIRRALETPQNL